jgi:hypothetical protein
MSFKLIATLGSVGLLTAYQVGSGDGNASQRAEEASGPAAPATPTAPNDDASPPPTAPAQSTPSQSR